MNRLRENMKPHTNQENQERISKKMETMNQQENQERTFETQCTTIKKPRKLNLGKHEKP